MKSNPFHFEGERDEFRTNYTTEEIQEWERICNERNFNTDITKFSTIKEIVYDILTRLKNIESRLNR